MKSIFFLVVMLFEIDCKAQGNLAPNPSFEDTVYCPCCTNQINAAANWMSFGNSPDYFNACAPFGISVPYSEFGFQYAHTGVAMAGLATYRNPAIKSNYREFIGIQLLNSLQLEMKYYLSFFVNFAYGPSVGLAANKIGCRFSTIAYSEFNEAPIDNFAELYTDSILIDSVQWYKLSGSFIADSSYSFLVIGNFFQDSLTDTLVVGPFPDYTYYYIDDVCVSTDSIYNETWWSGIPEQDNYQQGIEIFPNPVSSILSIKSSSTIDLIQILNSIGQLVFEKRDINDTLFNLSVDHLPAGLFFIRVKTKNASSNKLLIITHQY